ncbi:ribbon-helix-helix protein, CopG family [Amycolatopsis arida]|uniref:ribbon-helix-helix protein, CopG family n=1 Tax=Amycolatopsis arida TaxID=587909 RepID=UPI001FBAE495|nr:ribbon-helix-helix protein, CopG family [Amycolatopsis arida]
MNLRLSPEAEAALRAEARRTGRSQQDILREAVNRHLGLVPEQQAPMTDPLFLTGKVSPPRIPYRRAHPRRRLEPGESSLDILDRQERF